ncbi:hypothetical protein Tco_1059590 [Tanacetum coccineum]
MDIFTKGALWDYWKIGSDEIKSTDDESSNLEETDHDDEQEIGEIFRIETNLFNYETALCKEFKEFNYLLKDYEWYEALEDSELKEDALRNTAIMEGLINDDNDDESRYERNKRWNIYDNTNHHHEHEMDHKPDEREELCETHELPVCNMRRFKMIKYSFRQDGEYVAVKEK